MNHKIIDFGEDRRDLLLNAALKEFAQKGYDDASTNIIAKEANLSKSLMFHYIGSKQDLFLFVYDFFSAILNREYYDNLNHKTNDYINQFHQSFILQIALLKKYPWIFDLHRLSALTKSEELNDELKQREMAKKEQCCFADLNAIDESKFRTGLDIEISKHIILTSCMGFSNQILEKMKCTETGTLDITDIEKSCSTFFQELKHVFYRTEEEDHHEDE